MIEIEEKDLQTLLLQRKKFIKTRIFPVETLLALLAFVASAALSKFYLESKAVFYFIWVVIFAYLVYFLLQLRDFFVSDYSAEKLQNDIQNIAKKTHDFSLLVIKDSSNLHKGKFLLRYDKRWKCYLLPYKNTHKENDADFIKTYLTDDLLFENCVLGEPKSQTVTKFSVSANRTKTYNHTFYPVSFNCHDSLNISNKDTIKILGEKYRWFSIDEMKRDKNIMEKNGETVNYIASEF